MTKTVKMWVAYGACMLGVLVALGVLGMLSWYERFQRRGRGEQWA